ncbi:PRC-barrel domain-containing protein [Rhizobium sp. BK251]|uniref:PRC-barrel domain-containing protein n=1 Tax=Rhizobium sp. BK251 TaxID=2512125 RepID=UPI001050D1AE|nr:PRC-barrel domain-containing protein [Rhizobium sp. BK251]TCL75832.1 sporulation protein YlmC with PRC-barrel domain [Rhizobium sp. BK251]
MTSKLLTTVAAGALFATALAPAAFAQSATTPAEPAPSVEATQPATPAPALPADNAQAPAAAPSTDTAQAPAAPGSYLTEQSADQISANTYIGQSVYNSNNESIGSVNDLIMQKEGGLVAAVVGVGGFLGIGEKNVAVPMDKIAVAQNTQDGTVKLTTSETADSLKAAPEFKTLAMQSAERAPATTGTMPTDNTSTSSTTNN